MTENIVPEEWRPVVGWESLYVVSAIGVKSLRSGKMMVPRTNARVGYKQVLLSHNGKHVTRYVHQLVCEAFHGPRPRGMVTNHKNGIKTDNHPDNLEWVTQARNMQHAHENGMVNVVRGVCHGMCKLTEAQVREIRAAKGLQREIAARFGIARVTVYNIKNAQSWKHL